MVRLDAPQLHRAIKRADPSRSAQAARLHYVNDGDHGIRRHRAGDRFIYLDGKRRIDDAETLVRIKSLAIPPAWRDVWICLDPQGHLQAVGRDDRGRKQYRYHPRWREVRDETKYDRMRAFGKLLPHIRRRTTQDLAQPGLPRTKVLAAIVRIMMQTFLRVGNEEYAKSNGSYGLTTLRDRHAEIHGPNVRFSFKGKSGVHREIDLHDAQLARIVKACRDLPGQELFQYIDEQGEIQKISSEDVNNYLHEITGHDITAKDFRTWAGTLLAARALCAVKDFPSSRAAAKRNIVAAIKHVAAQLGNTPAVCKKCYIHPKVLDMFIEGKLNAHFAAGSEEHGLLSLLKSRMTAESSSDS